MSSNKRHPYLRGYAFWSQKKNKFWLHIKNLSPAGLKYYEDWIMSLKNDKSLQKSNSL